MRRAFVFLALLMGSLLLGGTAAAQQGGAENATAPTPPAAQDAGTVTGAGAPAPASGLPGRAPPPRTLRAHWHVFVAFAIVWVLLFGYALSLGRRLAGIEEELRRLGGGTPPA